MRHRTSSSHSRHSKQAAIERTGVNCSPTSHNNASRMSAIPRDHLRASLNLAQWQQLDIELIPLEARLQLVEREKARKQLFQRKNQAAVLIQRAWRKHRSKKRGSIARTVHSPRVL
ncbi:unnamed protein product [Staurois parvus]|uniref:Uncharacterized protein n=1 Tax=Staurois parvus TaxID=386267 RepID=A0ABN9HIP4_9NEOB|nr:unnamed protein product [Staurois parvus]